VARLLAHSPGVAPEVTLAAVDVRQLEDDSWRVIELGDPQFSGIGHMPHHAFWHALSAASPEQPSIAETAE
jgi:hypothetical protein